MGAGRGGAGVSVCVCGSWAAMRCSTGGAEAAAALPKGPRPVAAAAAAAQAAAAGGRRGGGGEGRGGVQGRETWNEGGEAGVSSKSRIRVVSESLCVVYGQSFCAISESLCAVSESLCRIESFYIVSESFCVVSESLSQSVSYPSHSKSFCIVSESMYRIRVNSVPYPSLSQAATVPVQRERCLETQTPGPRARSRGRPVRRPARGQNAATAGGGQRRRGTARGADFDRAAAGRAT